MDESKEIKKEDKKPEVSPADAGEGDKPKTPQTIVDANLAAKRLEEANAKHAELLAKQEDMIARKILGGGSEAGNQPVVKEETPQEYKTRIEKEIQEGKHDD